MPVILWIMATVVGPLPQAQGAMDVLRRGKVSVVPHDGDIWPDEGLSEGGCLPHESRNHTLVALGQHGGHDVPLG